MTGPVQPVDPQRDASGKPPRAPSPAWVLRWQARWPGLAVSAVVALAAMFLGKHYGAPVLLFALLLGMALWRYEGRLPADLSTMVIGADREQLRTKTCGLQPEEMKAIRYCMQDKKQGSPQFIALGDSKAEALIYGLSRESGPQQAWMMISEPNFLSPRPANDIALARIERDPAIRVVLLNNALRGMTPVEAGTGRILQPPTPAQMQDWLQAYAAVFERLHRSGRHVVFVLDHPTLPDPNDCISGRMSNWPLLGDLLYRQPNPLCTQRYSDHLRWTAPYYEFARRLQAENPQVMVYNPVPLLCDSATDLCPMARQGQFLYSYGDHLSDVANSLIARDLLPRIRERWSLP